MIHLVCQLPTKVPSLSVGAQAYNGIQADYTEKKKEGAWASLLRPRWLNLKGCLDQETPNPKSVFSSPFQ